LLRVPGADRRYGMARSGLPVHLGRAQGQLLGLDAPSKPSQASASIITTEQLDVEIDQLTREVVALEVEGPDR
jgi:hypothetical protein